MPAKKINRFRFKQFDIIQEKAAMKIGTDGVLLGAWVNVGVAKNILDIGTGTGILSLQLAQRNSTARIIAIDIDEKAIEEAKLNVKNSPWHKRIEVIHTSLQNFTISCTTSFDLIICNPPFYNNTYLPEDEQRAMARHSGSLDFETLLSSMDTLLLEDGHAAIIIPVDIEKIVLNISKNNHLYPEKICHVRGNERSKIKRSLILLSKQKSEVIRDEMVVELDRHIYTEDYKKLVQDFYLAERFQHR